MKHIKRWMVMSSLVIAIGTYASAETTQAETGFSVGAQAGVGFANNDVGSAFTFGGTVGYRLFPMLQVAGFVNYIGLGGVSNDDVSIKDSGQHITYYGLEGNYLLTGLIENASVGVKIGLANSSISGEAPGTFEVSDSTTHFLIGPKIAYDYPIASGFSLGGEANILFKTTSDDPLNFPTTYGVSTLWNLLAAVKYHF